MFVGSPRDMDLNSIYDRMRRSAPHRGPSGIGDFCGKKIITGWRNMALRAAMFVPRQPR
jgi:hypothetical protein